MKQGAHFKEPNIDERILK